MTTPTIISAVIVNLDTGYIETVLRWAAWFSDEFGKDTGLTSLLDLDGAHCADLATLMERLRVIPRSKHAYYAAAILLSILREYECHIRVGHPTKEKR